MLGKGESGYCGSRETRTDIDSVRACALRVAGFLYIPGVGNELAYPMVIGTFNNYFFI